MDIRAATAADQPAVWAILRPVFAAGETYAVPREWTEAEAISYWFQEGRQVFVAEESGRILGTYCLQANQQGGGAHVAKCGYVTSQSATGRGIARAMCLDSLERARAAGFLAMQFNFVSALTSAPFTCGKIWDSRLSARCPKRFCIPRAATWMFMSCSGSCLETAEAGRCPA